MKSGVHACLSRRRSRVRIPSSPQLGQIAQSVEHLSEKQGVGSSILPLATINIGSIGLYKQTRKNYDQFLQVVNFLSKYCNNFVEQGKYIKRFNSVIIEAPKIIKI